MEILTFAQITTNELKAVIRDELEAFFASRDAATVRLEEIGGVELAVRITGLSKATIYSLSSGRKIPHSKRGKRLYFSKSDLIEWLRSGKRRTRAELLDEAQEPMEKRKGGATREGPKFVTK